MKSYLNYYLIISIKTNVVVAESVPDSTDIVTFENEASGQSGSSCNRIHVCENQIEYNSKMNACQSKELHEKELNNDCRIDIPETTKAELCPQKTESLTFSCNIITEDVISSNLFQKTNHINMLSHQRPSIAPNSNTERKKSSDNCHASCGENKICDESFNGYWCEACKIIKCCEDPDFVSGCTEGFFISIRIFVEVYIQYLRCCCGCYIEFLSSCMKEFWDLFWGFCECICMVFGAEY